MSGEEWNAILPQIGALLGIVLRADVAAALVWSESFLLLMPLPDVCKVELVDKQTSRAVMWLTEINITVNTGRIVASGLPTAMRCQVLRRKDCSLVFLIANPHIFSAFATVEWTVGNKGKDAGDRSDLGHRQIGFRMLKAEKRTLCTGTVSVR